MGLSEAHPPMTFNLKGPSSSPLEAASGVFLFTSA
jgi:hypothetical protein